MTGGRRSRASDRRCERARGTCRDTPQQQHVMDGILRTAARRPGHRHQQGRTTRPPQLRGAPPMVGCPRTHIGGRPRAHRGRQLVVVRVPTATRLLPPLRQLLDTEAHEDGVVLLVRLPLPLRRVTGAPPCQTGAAGDTAGVAHAQPRHRHQRAQCRVPPRQANDGAGAPPRQAGAPDHGCR